MGMVVQWDAVPVVEFERVRSLDEDGFVDWLEEYGQRRSFDVDKAWHAVHFLLTGTAQETAGPLGAVVLGGEEFGGDLGYGPPRWLSPTRVDEAATALAAISDDEARSRLDFSAMQAADIYPSIWDRDPAAEHLDDFVLDGVSRVRAGFIAAAADVHGMIVTML